MRDLYPYRLALHQIDNMKSPVLDKDGNETGVKKWLGRDGSVPEGQAILRAQFEEVEQTINESEYENRELDAVPTAEDPPYSSQCSTAKKILMTRKTTTMARYPMKNGNLVTRVHSQTKLKTLPLDLRRQPAASHLATCLCPAVQQALTPALRLQALCKESAAGCRHR